MVADNKLKNFVQARQAVKAQRFSRGFCHFQPGMKGAGKMGKGKGKSKKGKPPYHPATPSSPVSATSLPVMPVESVMAMRLGDRGRFWPEIEAENLP